VVPPLYIYLFNRHDNYVYIYTYVCIGSSDLISYNLAKIQGSNNPENYIQLLSLPVHKIETHYNWSCTQSGHLHKEGACKTHISRTINPTPIHSLEYSNCIKFEQPNCKLRTLSFESHTAKVTWWGGQGIYF
jgi:hypothetical protein